MFDLFKNKETSSGCFVLFDIGGTKMRVAASFDGKTIGKTAETETPKDFGAGLKVLSSLAEEVCEGQKAVRAGGGIAGILSRDHASIFRAPNLSGWDGAPLQKEFSRILGAPVLLENDAALAALAEARLGAGKGGKIIAYFTVSTGLGGARVVSGEIDDKIFGFEPGHQIIGEEGGDLEAHVSGASLAKRFGKNPTEIDDERIQTELAVYLARGLYNSILHWSPDVLVLGGPLILGERPISLDKVKAELIKLPRIFPELPEIKKAALGKEAGILGALLLLQESVSKYK